MKNIQLNNKQLNTFLINKLLMLTEKSTLILHNDDLLLSYNNSLYFANSVNICFEQELSFDYLACDYVRNLICEHFNIKPYEAIFLGSSSPEEFNFKIVFLPNIEWNIYVCTFKIALKNSNDLSDENINAGGSDYYIGPYRKLGNSCYYFRRIIE